LSGFVEWNEALVKDINDFYDILID